MSTTSIQWTDAIRTRLVPEKGAAMTDNDLLFWLSIVQGWRIRGDIEHQLTHRAERTYVSWRGCGLRSVWTTLVFTAPTWSLVDVRLRWRPL